MQTSSKSIKSFVDTITVGLPRVDRDFLLQKISKSGVDITARWLGSDVNSWQNLLVGGRMIVHEINKHASKNLTEYLSSLSRLLRPEIVSFIEKNKDELENLLAEHAHLDNDYDFLSARKFNDTYLLKVARQPQCVETIQQCHLRLAMQLYHAHGLEKVIRCYKELAHRYYTHATPTIFGASLRKGQMSSCFLLTCPDDSNGMMDTMKYVAFISKKTGGIGLDVSRVRHSEIGENGYSKGLPPLMYTVDALIKQFNQEGLRNGACTVYTRVHHIDLYAFCEAGLKSGDHYLRMHNINTALWTCWLFWQRVENDEMWTMFCPNKTIELENLWGIEFNQRYVEYEKEFVGNPLYKKYYIQHKARDVLKHITKCQCHSSMPYILHGDACNMKSNQKFLGYIRSSNLCLEIVEWSSDDEIPSCNLGSISMKAFVRNSTGNLLVDYDFDKLGEQTRHLTENLNRVIEYNEPPLPQIKVNNDKYRPLGMGVTGLAEALYAMDLHFEHPLAEDFNKMFFACMYFNALLESINESIQYGAHHRFAESPMAQGKLQFDLWQDEFQMLKQHNLLGQVPTRKAEDDLPLPPSTWGQKPFQLINGRVVGPTWGDLKSCISEFGVRNSLLLALMPSATTSTIMMNTETTEAPTGNLYERRLMNGSFPVINTYLEEDARKIGLWNKYLLQLLEADNGSIAMLDKLVTAHPELFPDFTGDFDKIKSLQVKYKTMWELPMRKFVKLSADRARYIDQSQSLNLYFADPTKKLLRAAHLATFKAGLKTGMYYLRQLPASESSKITVDASILNLVLKHKLARTKPKKILPPKPTTYVTDVSEVSESDFSDDADLPKPQGPRLCTKDGCFACQ